MYVPGGEVLLVREARLAASPKFPISQQEREGGRDRLLGAVPVSLPCRRGRQADGQRLRCLGRGRPVDESVLGGARKGWEHSAAGSAA